MSGAQSEVGPMNLDGSASMFLERAADCLRKLRTSASPLGAAQALAADSLEQSLRCQLLDAHRVKARALRKQREAELSAFPVSAGERSARKFQWLLALQAELYLDSVWACCEAMALARDDAQRDSVAYPAMHGPLAKALFEDMHLPGDADITHTVWRLVEAWPRRSNLAVLVPAAESLLKSMKQDSPASG
jgi:hypothetical protein